MTLPALRPSGAPDSPALTWRGETWTYAEWAQRIAAVPRAPVTDISRMTVPEALACCFAAAASGDAVLVSDPGLPPARIEAFPAGTWLLASTSGTSGHPRIICRTATSWAASVTPLAVAAGLTAADRVALTGPLHATLHLHAAIHTLCLGAHLVDDVSRATAVHTVPAVLQELVERAPPPDLRTVIVAGAALPDRVAERVSAHGMTVLEYFGAAETSFIAARRWPEPLLRPFPGAELRTDESGTLWVRSPYLATGYARVSDAGRGTGLPDEDRSNRSDDAPQPTATDRTGPLRRSDDGFVTVGDLVSTPKSGPMGGIVVRGRGSSAITVGGFTVVAEEVEAVLRQIPGVRAAAAVGTPHPRLGQIVTAVVELDGARTLAEVRSVARNQFSGAARPRRYIAVERLPRTSSGKVSRTQAAALAPGAGSLRDTLL